MQIQTSLDVTRQPLLDNVDIPEVASIEIGEDIDDEAGEQTSSVELSNKSCFFLLGPIVGSNAAYFYVVFSTSCIAELDRLLVEEDAAYHVCRPSSKA